MLLGAMQPYFFPYIGYFQLIEKCDFFVFLDDAQYINRGWSNRNRVLTNGRPSWIRVPVRRERQTATFAEREPILDARVRTRLLKHLYHAYHDAPQFDSCYRLIESLLLEDGHTVASFNIRAIEAVLDHVGLERKLAIASQIDPKPGLKGQHRILNLCSLSGCGTYANPIGGAHLYDPGFFEAAGVELKFLDPELDPYPQSTGEFVPGLSVIDPLMWCHPSEVRGLFQQGLLLDPAATKAT